MASNHSAVSRNTRSSSRSIREAGMKMKQDEEVALIPAAAAASASHHKRKRAEKKKQDEEVVLISAATAVAAAAAPQKSEIAEKKKKKSPISVNKKIPLGKTIVITPAWSFLKFNMHTSLAGKKVVIYGLTGYFDAVVQQNNADSLIKRMRWKPFYNDRVMKPALEFIEQAEVLTANGVDEIVLYTVNPHVLCGVMKNREIMSKYDYVKFISEPNYIHALGIGLDIPQDGMPPRSRRFLLLVDDLKVKFANIESIDGNFTIPNAAEIIKAFEQ